MAYPTDSQYSYPCLGFLSHDFKILLTLYMEFFWIGNPTFFWVFFDIDRNYVLIIITIVINITVLLSYSIIWFGYLKTLPKCLAPPSSHYQVFIRFDCCFARNTLSTLFVLISIFVKDNAFSKLNNFFLLTHCWSGLILLFCLLVFFTAFLTVLLW